MDTPKSGREQRLTRAHTPRMSERKKQLFGKPNYDDDISKDLIPLSRANSLIRVESTNNLPLLVSPSHMIVRKTNDGLTNITPIRRSARILSNEFAMTPTSSKLQIFNNDGKENLPLEMTNMEETCNTEVEGETDELQRIFNNSCNVSEPPAPKTPNTTTTTQIDDDNSDNNNMLNEPLILKKGNNHGIHAQKRTHNDALMLDESPSCAKILRGSLSSAPLFISPKSFYSRPKSILPEVSTPRSVRGKSLPPMTLQRTTSSRNRRTSNLHKINKGVHHKVRRSVDASRQHMTAVSVDRIINNIRNDRLRQLVLDKREERAKIEEVHNILRNVKNPIEMARPLSVLGEKDASLSPPPQPAAVAAATNGRSIEVNAGDNNNNNNEHKNNELFHRKYNNINSNYDKNLTMDCDFSDCEIESDENSDTESVLTETNNNKIGDVDDNDEIPDNMPKRKFFKSGHNTNTKKEIKLFENVKASIFKGKISLITKPKKVRRYKSTASNNISFSQEQATVNAILANLDDISFVEKQQQATIPTSSTPATSNSSTSFKLANSSAHVGDNPSQILNYNKQIKNNDNDEAQQLKLYEHYQSLLPYETNDPAMKEQQETLLYFLYSNNICTEDNFNIFIAELDQHKEEAARIVEEVVSTMNDNDMLTETGEQHNNQSERVDTKTPDLLLSDKDPTPPSSPIIGLQNTNVKYHPIFYPEHRQNVNNMKVTPLNASRQPMGHWRGGEGSDQRQIDAGQREFGARECKQCGLVYTMHEPEEEKLHRQFHESQHILRFKGWIDEDVIATYAEWSSDGRILRVTESAPTKRRERLKEILALVDLELGYSSYIMPKTFVAFLAVRKQQIVGVCLVQPLTKANKYVCSSGIDCCTTEEYDARCGISRIWVSPLHRRLRIATKLLEAVQRNIIPNEEITRDKIAFSAPTQQGLLLAQRFTGLTDFLIYQ